MLPALDAKGRVLALRVLALALCLDGHVNLPDRFFFVRCARAAGMPVDAAAMRQFRSLEKLFGSGALNASALTELFAQRSAGADDLLGRRQVVVGNGVLRRRAELGKAKSGWWADVLTTLAC